MIFSHHLLYYTYIQSFLYSWNWWCDCQLQITSRQFFKHIFWSLPKRTSATTYASAIGNATIFKTVTFSSRRLSQMKWNESGFRPPLCTYRLNWARRTSWGWWDDWDDTVLQTQDSKVEPWRSEAEHATSRSRRLPTILSFTRGWGRNIFVYFKPPRPGTEPRTLAWKAAVLTTTLGPPPAGCRASHVAFVVALVCGQSCNFRVSRGVTRHVPNRADVRVGVFCT